MVATLRAHQVEAVDAAVKALEIPPSGEVPPNGLRATVVSACGTGKTIMAAHAAKRLVPHGRILVLVPTLELLSQTIAAWRKEGHTGRTVAVCSLEGDPSLFMEDVRVTTSAPQLALWASDGRPMTVFTTYSSLGVLTEAHRTEGLYGIKPLGLFDLAIVDEAHRTSGSLGKAWAAIHHQDEVPAARRLYMTATPRLWQPRPAREGREGVREALPPELAASMDDEAIFGPTVFELPLGEAVRRGILARFQIVVLELKDPLLYKARKSGQDMKSETVRGARMAALQTAVLEAAAEHDLKTCITYHSRTMEAEAWAKGLPGVARRLHAEDPTRHVDPDRVWADWLCGEHEPTYRREVLSQFAQGIDDNGKPVHRAVLSNCRVLSEGVDVRAVDSVAIVDPKASVVEIVQVLGRALRKKSGEGKLASIVVPVFLGKSETNDDMHVSGSYRQLVNVMTALRAHDNRMIEQLAIPQENTAPQEPSERIGDGPGEGEDEQRLLLRFSTKRDPNTICKFVQMQVIDPERAQWARGYRAAERYFEEHGHLHVPLGYRAGEDGDFPLGGWVSEMRRAYGTGTLSEQRVKWLNELGMVWSVPDAAWEAKLSVLRSYAGHHYDSLAAPKSAVWGEDEQEIAVGMLVANLRRPGGLGKNPERAATRAAQLADLDPDWDVPWSLDWQRGYVKTRACLEGGAGMGELQPGVMVDGEDIGRWLQRQRERWSELTQAQQERLDELGVQPAPKPHKAAQARERAGGGARAAAFDRAVAALRQYREREGHVKVPRQHVEEYTDADGALHRIRLGVFRSNARSRRSAMSPEQQAVLDELGV
jgi:superfamily II DNA or RNA helicase